ncbi:putative ORFan [Tupanvirus deep ocean]|uniref:ORFan n=2 Tax=Tupanvirus TaxID=2094720 RepID=A0AC62A7D9_9VIRU|nr:putative ORFan [Tupanvirus deep ocean]QKU33691.1 putative ORFan [Tupanvirus deep ocean]
MEEFANHCNDFRPNITYIAVGSAYSSTGGSQQHPPFIKKLMLNYPEFSFQIILVDPLIENPPEITKHFQVKKLDNNWYGNDNVNIHVINEYFDFNNKNRDTTSKKFLFALIDRTINSKNECPSSTYLMFLHDFSGNNIGQFSDEIYEIYKNYGNTITHLYKKNILIDLNNKIDSGCFVDLESVYFHPILIKNSLGSMEIFNPFMLDDFEIYSILTQNYKNINIKIFLMHVIIYRINKFVENILPLYRQIRISLDSGNGYLTKLLENDNKAYILYNGVDVSFSQEKLKVVNKITENMLLQLNTITKFLDYFKCDIQKEIFSEFINFCQQTQIINHYDILKVFRVCQKKMEVFLLGIEPHKYYTDLNNHAVKFVMTNGKLPLFIELLLQDITIDKNNSNNFIGSTENTCLNDTAYILEL